MGTSYARAHGCRRVCVCVCALVLQVQVVNKSPTNQPSKAGIFDFRLRFWVRNEAKQTSTDALELLACSSGTACPRVGSPAALSYCCRSSASICRLRQRLSGGLTWSCCKCPPLYGCEGHVLCESHSRLLPFLKPLSDSGLDAAAAEARGNGDTSSPVLHYGPFLRLGWQTDRKMQNVSN